MIWQRFLTFFSGADVYSVTLIVAAFMGGLGFGSLAGGHLADRLRPTARFLAFAASELAIAAFAFWSVPILYEWLFLRLGTLPLPAPLVAGLLFAVLLWPTFFMGLSLPLLARVLTDRPGRSAERIGGLYGWNTLGAALGALLTIWVLARTLGFAGAIRIGAFLNLACAAAALLVVAARGRRGAGAGPEDAQATEAAPLPENAVEAPLRFGLRAWLALYALSGFVALSLEILWFRVLGTIHKPSSFTFSTLLAIYLLGLGGGALLGRRWARSARRPVATFFALQAGIGLYAGLSLGLLTAALGRLPGLGPLWRYLGEYETLALDEAVRATARLLARGGDVAPFTVELAAQFTLLYGLVPLYLIGPPTLLMGMSFPFIQKAVQTDLARLGRRVGGLQAANIVGSTLGAGLTGLVLLHTLGSAGTLRLLVGLAGVFLFMFCRLRWPEGPSQWRAAGAALLLLALSLFAAPSASTLWAKLHGTTPDRILFAEDGSGLSVLKDEGSGPERHVVVYVDGLGQSKIPYGGYHTLLGALPVMLHPNPESVAVIGLGSGDTLFGISGRAETRRILCLEIVAPQLRTLQMLARERRFPGLTDTITDGRVEYLFTDGRTFLMRTTERFDVIEADALRPGTPYVGNLYSLEYFELLKRRLKPGGFGVTWCPTARIRSTFLRAFPYVLFFGETLIGSNEPIAFDRAAIQGRVRAPFTASHFARAGVDPEAILAEAIDRGPTAFGPEHDRAPYVDINTDLFPKDEYLSSRRFLPGKGTE